MVIPKFDYWEIWLAQNKAVFQQISLHPTRATTLACSLVVKAIQIQGLKGMLWLYLD
jgi:hypothetical protein